MSPQARIEVQLNSCRELQYDRPLEALVFAQEALAIAKKFKLKERALHSQRMIGICYFAHHQYDVALEHFETTLPGYRRMKDRVGESRALQNVALTLRQLGRNEEAIEMFRQSERIVRSLGDDSVLMAILTSVGSMYSVIGRPKDSLQAFSECLTIAERLDDAGMRARITGNIADVYAGIGDTSTSIEWSRRSLELHRSNGDNMGVGLTLSNLGRVYQRTGDLDAALATMSEALVVMTSLHDVHARGRIMMYLSTILLAKRRFAQAQAMSEEALDIFRQTNDAEREVGCLITSAEISLHQKDHERAHRSLESAAKRMRSIDNANLEIEILEHQAALLNAKGAWQEAIKKLNRGSKLAEQQMMHNQVSELERQLAVLYEDHHEYTAALRHERKASAAQQAADAELRAQHSQGLQLRLDMEREARERERIQAANERLTLQLNTKERELNTNVLAIAQKNELLSELAADLQQAVRSNDTERIQHLRDVLRKIDVHRRTGEDWKNFQEQLADVHDTFIRALTSKHPSLTAKEVQLASFLKLNLSSKEISQVLSIGVASIEVYRSNLRKKLGLSGGMSLTTYIQSL
jgi:DNA-binding CsgD family transcriptional regulator